MNLNLIDRKGKHFFLNLLTANSGNKLTELKILHLFLINFILAFIRRVSLLARVRKLTKLNYSTFLTDDTLRDLTANFQKI